MVNGGAQVKVYAPKSSILDGTAQVPCWDLPGYICILGSSAVMMAVGRDTNPAIVHTRVAEALGITDGDTIDFDLRGYTERLSLKVTVKDIMTDFLVHPLIQSVPSLADFRSGLEGDVVKFQNGEEVHLFSQHMFAGLSIADASGKAILTFDGASRNNPHGPAGCGFAIYSTRNGSSRGDYFVMGSRYFGKASSNVMEYHGLLEGLYWALRLKLEYLIIEGDSELVIRQMMGDYRVKSANLRPLHRKAIEMLDGYSNLKVTYRHISRNDNSVSDSLANQAIDLKENSVCCNWDNVNRQCKRAPW